MSDRENKIIIDWLAFTVHDLSLDDVISLLGLNSILGEFEDGKGSNGYSDRLYFNSISIHYNGRADMGIHINMSGQGCRAFESYSEYGEFDELLLRIFNLERFNITRLDVAYDDFINCLPIDDIVSSVHKQEWLSPSNMKWWEAVYSADGISAYIGSPRSNIRFRFYDKAAEKKKEYQWTRLEIQMRDIVAVMFASSWITGEADLNYLFFGVLNKYVKFINLDNVRKTRCSVKDWWSDFLQTEDKVTLHKPGISYNLMNMKNMTINKAGNSIQAYLSIYGISSLLQELDQERPLKDLPKKYKNLIRNYIKDFTDSHLSRSWIEHIDDETSIEVIEDMPIKFERLLDELEEQ